jgi:hypothetical protein
MDSWRDVADYRRTGYEFRLFPPPSISPEAETVARIRAEIDPWFVPLWLTREYESATGGCSLETYVVLGRYRKNPPPNARVIKGLPLGPKGEKIQLICVVNGLDDEDREKGKTGHYVPLRTILEDLRKAYKEMSEEREFMDAAAVDDAQERAWAEAEAKKKRDLVESISYMRHNDRDQINQDNGYTGRTFVSSTLKLLREAAGSELGVPSSKEHVSPAADVDREVDQGAVRGEHHANG